MQINVSLKTRHKLEAITEVCAVVNDNIKK